MLQSINNFITWFDGVVTDHSYPGDRNLLNRPTWIITGQTSWKSPEVHGEK